MDGKNDENSCGICLENLLEARLLPCWHVACLRCILGMTQIGQGRAVSCHICRTPFLFENIRSLPRPINCKVCGKNVTNPKKFPCCNDLYCTDCVRTAAVDGIITCRNLCTTTDYSVDEPLAVKLCQVCFRFHTEPPRDCQHSSCSSCYETPGDEPRPCCVCQAIAAPNPVPQNPQAPMLINAQQALPHGTSMPPDQVLDPVGERFTQDIAGIAQNESQRMILHLFDHRRYNWTDRINDLPKFVIFYVTLALMLYRHGLCGWTWIIPALAMLSMNPRLETVYVVCAFTNIGIITYGLFSYFYQAAILGGVEILCSVMLIYSKDNVRMHISIVCNLVLCVIIVSCLEPLFLYGEMINGFMRIVQQLLENRDYLV